MKKQLVNKNDFLFPSCTSIQFQKLQFFDETIFYIKQKRPKVLHLSWPGKNHSKIFFYKVYKLSSFGFETYYADYD